MSVQINANQFSLAYFPDEDRLLFSVALSAEHQLGMLLTRRLTRIFIDALIKYAPAASFAEGDRGVAGEPSRAAQGGSETGDRKEEPRPKPLAVPPKLVREVKILRKDGGDCALVFNSGEQQLALDIAAQRISAVVRIFLDVIGKAGWDFPDLASWPKDPMVAEAEGKVLH